MDLIDNRRIGLSALCLSLLTILFISTYPSSGWCEEPEPKEPLTFTFYWENDSINGTDRDYTNGLKLTWSRPYTEQRMKKGGLTAWLIDRLPFGTRAGRN